MRRTVAALPLLLVLAGCGATTEAPEAPTVAGPTTPSVSLAEALQTTPAVPPPVDEDARFLALLTARHVPWESGRDAVVDAGLVCATLASDETATRDEVGSLVLPSAQLQHQRWFVDSAVEVYCPQFAAR